MSFADFKQACYILSKYGVKSITLDVPTWEDLNFELAKTQDSIYGINGPKSRSRSFKLYGITIRKKNLVKKKGAKKPIMIYKNVIDFNTIKL